MQETGLNILKKPLERICSETNASVSLLPWSRQAFTVIHFIIDLKAVDTEFVLLTAGQIRTTAEQCSVFGVKP